MRPTGRLHIGHYFGALQNWVKLQNDPQNECFFFIADWHALTSDYADTSQVAQNTIEIATDWLASGLDPAKCTMFIQSSVPEHAELYLLLSMVTPLGWLERVPTYKEALENIKNKDIRTYGFLGYPVLQAADIVMYGEPERELIVPVGEDQGSHVELTREIVRKFNFHYGIAISNKLFSEAKSEWLGKLVDKSFRLTLVRPDEAGFIDLYAAVKRGATKRIAEIGADHFLEEIGIARKWFRIVNILREPQVMLTQTPRIPGTDGRKMSKSYDNFISLSESNDSIRKKTRAMMTDPERKRRTDRGNPDVCPVFSWHKLFSEQGTIDRVNRECRTAEIGCVDCKGLMADSLIEWIEPVRARRQEYAAHPDKVLQILDEGSAKAREVAVKTMERVRDAVFDWDKVRAAQQRAGNAAHNVKVGD